MNSNKSPLITAINLILYYIVVMIVGTLGCAVIFTVYKLCTHLVAGQGLGISFNAIYFKRGIFLFAPVIFMLSNALMVFYLIRHSSRSWLPLLVYVALYALSWLILVPIDFTLEKKFLEKPTTINFQKSVTELSPGYFRTTGEDSASGDQIWYYSKVSELNVATGLCKNNDNIYTFNNLKLSSNSDFSDPLIKKTVEMNSRISYIAKKALILLNLARAAFFAGTLQWINFLTIALALLSVAGLRHISSWRLVNVLMIICFALAVFTFNIECYTGTIFSLPQKFFTDLFGGLPFLVNPFVSICNVFLFIVFTSLGFIIDIRRKGDFDSQALEDNFGENY